MTDRITKAEQRIINLIAERPNAIFLTFDWLVDGWTAEQRATATKESMNSSSTSPRYVMVGDEDQGWWEDRTTLSVMIKLAKRGFVQSFDDVDADSYFSKTVRPVTSSEVA